MPMRSQHFPISFAEWERLPRPPGWKYEYYDDYAHVTPSHQLALTTVGVAPRAVNAPCALRPALPEDEAPLLAAYLEAFADDPAFCDYTDEQFHEAAVKDLHDSFAGRRAPLLGASRVAVSPDNSSNQLLVGAALLSRDREYGAVLDLLFIRPAWQRRGLATALVASAMNALHQASERMLTSSYHLANLPSQTWHRAFGFLERPDLRYAEVYLRYARHELFRREASADLTAAGRTALEGEVVYWQNQVAVLQRLAEEQGFRAVYPRLPHW